MEHHKKDHKAREMHHEKKGEHKTSHHRIMATHTFEDHNPYVLPSMHAKMVTSQNRKNANVYPWSRDDTAIPTQMHGSTRNVQQSA